MYFSLNYVIRKKETFALTRSIYKFYGMFLFIFPVLEWMIARNRERVKESKKRIAGRKIIAIVDRTALKYMQIQFKVFSRSACICCKFLHEISYISIHDWMSCKLTNFSHSVLWKCLLLAPNNMRCVRTLATFSLSFFTVFFSVSHSSIHALSLSLFLPQRKIVAFLAVTCCFSQSVSCWASICVVR